MTTPDWLKQRGELKLGSDKSTWFIVIGGKPLYDLTTVPAGGKHSVSVRQTNNAKLIGEKGAFGSPTEAIAGGLDVLKAFLGW